MRIYLGDCLAILRGLEANSVDSLVTDPPAGIGFMGKDWDSDKGGRKEWCAWMESVMREAMRVMKPGAHGLVWAIPRTSHWTATALEDAGFEIRDVVTHLFGSGFPKSLDVSNAIDKAAGAKREVIGNYGRSFRPHSENTHEGWDRPSHDAHGAITAPATDAAKQWAGWGTALKPASEHWILVRKPLSEKTIAANVRRWGTGAINIDASRIGFENEKVDFSRVQDGNIYGSKGVYGKAEQKEVTALYKPEGRFPANLVLSHSPHCTDEACDMFDCPVSMLDAQSGGASRFFFNASRDKQIPCDLGHTFAGETGKEDDNKNCTVGCGSKPTGLFQPDTISIIKTATTSIISFPILCASTQKNIGNCTLESVKPINQSEALSIESVSVAENGEGLISFTQGQRAPIPATVKNAPWLTLPDGESKTGNTGTPTIAGSAKRRATDTIKNTSRKTANASTPAGVSAIENAPPLTRFLYCAKISGAERNAGLEKFPDRRHRAEQFDSRWKEGAGEERLPIKKNHHPTVKPKKLMGYLIRMITPPGGVVLDPFMGSGSTGIAAKESGFGFCGVEKSPEYFEISMARLAAVGKVECGTKG